ncbi:uncharacterized protein LOC128233872 [Mya arenaria]|uniref:uncharacterized protein LOC128233872 n=1 Tax=Mya arenaria TaxID=6604 RepID=UPI0022E817CB|nr:uncharacterized protein LOC128233872 [Mya arenaria]
MDRGVIWKLNSCSWTDDTFSLKGSDTDSPGCNAAQTYEELSKKTYTMVYDALKKGEEHPTNIPEHPGSGTESPRCNAAQTYEELSMKTEKEDNGPDNYQVYTPLDEFKIPSHMNYGNVKNENPVYNNTVL